jgi:hypothetical protein
MNKYVKIILIIAAFGLVAAALVWKFYINKPHQDIENATPDFSMTTEELWKQFATDEQKAGHTYNDKVIELTGTVGRVVDNDSVVSVAFIMEADSMFGDKSISCEMLKKYNDEAKALSKGNSVKIKGYCAGFIGDIKFNKCSIVK